MVLGTSLGNTLKEHIRNLMGTYWELNRNIEGTCWDQRKKKKLRHFECMLSLPIDGMKFIFPKLSVTCANSPIIKWVYLFIILIMLLEWAHI